MIKRVRPVIIAVENTTKVVPIIKEIVEDIREGKFWEDYKISVDIFEILTDTSNKEPSFTRFQDVSYSPRIVNNTEAESVDLTPLFDYLCKFEFLRKKRLYVQPIVLIALDGSKGYSFSEKGLNQFRKSFIYSSSLRVLNFVDFSWMGNKHDTIIDVLANEGEGNDEFLYCHLYASFECAFWLMEETFPKVKTDVIVEPPFPKDTIIVNGEIVRVMSKSLRKIARWRKEMKEFNHRYKF